MKDKEFNQNIGIEYRQSKDLELVRAIDVSPMRENSSVNTEYIKSEEFHEFDIEEETKEQSDNRKTAARKKKILKMAIVTVGTVSVLSAIYSAPHSNHSHENCVFSTDYNDMFDELLNSVENEDFDTFAQLMASDEMENCLATMCAENYEQMKQNDHLVDCPLFMYNGSHVTNCTQECYETKYDVDEKNIYVQVAEYDNGFDTNNGSFRIAIAPSLRMTEDYIKKAKEVDVTMLRIYYPKKEYALVGVVDEGILRLPSMIVDEQMTVTGYDVGKNYRSIDLGPNDMSGSYEIGTEVTCVSWDAGLRGSATAVVNFAGMKFDYVIGDDGHAIAEQSYLTFSPEQSEDGMIPGTVCLAELDMDQREYESYYHTGAILFWFDLLDTTDNQNGN